MTGTAPRIVHLHPDSPFLPFTMDVFETVAPGTGTYLVYARTGDLDRHPRPASATVSAIAADAAGLATASRALAGADVVIAHSMTPFATRVVRSAPARATIVWSGWGGDYYGSNASALAGLLGPQSEAFRRSRLSPAGRVLQPLKRRRASSALRAAARASDVFSAPIPDDFAVFSRRFRGFRGRYSQLNYASVEDTFSPGAHEITGDDILVGNSATLTNNHVEVFEQLARIGVGGRRVVVPLSYGDPAYASYAAERGRQLLGSDFVPLRDFMPLAEYQRVIADCNLVVMGHRRQQGIGNVAAAMWSGAQVFLDERSPLSTFLRERGAHAGTLAGLSTSGLPAGRITGAELAANRRVLQEFWGRDVVLANARALVESIGERL
ncbi:MAG: hypothetical protein JWP32_2147 [Schumannella sp.]|nr:hypothetical protein [Schumannella sp.]